MKKIGLVVLFLLTGAMLFAGAGADKGGAADNYPTKPIRFIFGNAGGGGQEIIARLFQPYVEKELGVPLNFEFIPGAAAAIATNVTKMSPPDGYTIMINWVAGHIITQLYFGGDWELDDFEYLSLFCNDPTVLYAKNTAPWNDLNDFVAYVRTKPRGSVPVGISSVGDISYLGLKLIEEIYNIEFNIIPYDGGATTNNALVRGEILARHAPYFGNISYWDEFKVLCVQQGKTNIPTLRGVKTLNEQVGRTVEDNGERLMIMLPKGFSEKYPERAKKLYDSFYKAWTNPEFIQKVKETKRDGYMDVLDQKASQAFIRDTEIMIKANAKYFK